MANSQLVMYLKLIVLLTVHHCLSQQKLRATVWTQSFASNTASNWCQCQSWLDFWQFWIGDPSKVVNITLAGSLTTATYTCTGAPAQFIAFALATSPYSETQVTCESGVWYTLPQNHLPVAAGSAVGVFTSPLPCSNSPAIKPCWTDLHFGGFGSVNCGAPSQTFTVVVVSDITSATVTTPQLPTSVFWQDSFSGNVSSISTQCAKWRQFWQNSVPRGQSLSVTLTSSINGGISTTCSGPNVGLLATALSTPTSNGEIYCNEGSVWLINGRLVQVGGTPRFCNSQLSLRPCWPDSNFGGFGGSNCGSESQTFTANVTIVPKQISSICYSAVNLNSANGIFTISCNKLQLQCVSDPNCTNCTANGFNKTIGLYTCNPTNYTWFPTIPKCISFGQTTTTSTTTTSFTTVTNVHNTTTTGHTNTSATVKIVSYAATTLRVCNETKAVYPIIIWLPPIIIAVILLIITIASFIYLRIPVKKRIKSTKVNTISNKN